MWPPLLLASWPGAGPPVHRPRRRSRCSCPCCATPVCSPPMVTERVDRQHLAAARLWAASRFPYLATALFASPVVEAQGIGTVAVDEQWRLYVDPAVANHWTVDELGSTLVHHAGHL